MHDEANTLRANPNPAAGEPVSQNRCPVCRYSLRGLPAAHRCPECGVEYDQHTQVWRPRFSTPFRGMMVIMIVTFINGTIQFTIQTSRAARLFFAISILVFLAMPYFVWRMRPFVAVTPVGILTRWLWRTKLTPWSQIEYVGDFEANVKLRKMEYGFVDYTRYLPDKNAWAAFRRAVNEGLNRYKQASESESQTPSTTDTI